MARRMLSPIMTIKHYVHQSLVTVASGAILVIDAVDGVVAPATAAANQVQEGSVVKAVWFELWAVSIGAAGTLSSFTLSIEKRPSGGTPMTAAQSVNLGAYPNKKNIFYVTQGNIGSLNDGAQPIPLFKGWIKIPKGKQRVGIADEISLNIAAVGESLSVCGIFTYKEYR